MILCVAANPAVDVLYELEHLDVGHIHRPRRVVRTPGGKPLNVARAAQLLGADVAVVALLGGHSGQWITEELERAGIGCQAVTCAAATRQCVSVLDDRHGRLTEFYEPGPRCGAAEWQTFVACLAAASTAGAWVAVSGSLPPGSPPDGPSALVETARAAGAAVAVDVGGAALGDALRARPDLVKVNEAEARAGLGAGAQVPAARLAAGLAGAGSVGVVTRGAAGAVLCDGTGRCWSAASPTTGRYSVGCGDAFLAGMLSARVEGGEWDDALRAAVAVAASNALRPGAGCLDVGALERLRREVRVTRL